MTTSRTAPPLRSCRWTIALVAVLALLATAAVAQQAKRPLAHKDYAGWKSIANTSLSRDGKWLAYAVFPQEGDGELVARSLESGKEYRQSLGALPPAPVPDASEAEGPLPRRGVTISFTGDRFLIASTYPAQADVDKAKKEKKKPEEMPKGGMLIVDLASGAATRIADVKSFQAPEKGTGWIAYLKEPKPQAAEKEADARGASPAGSPGTSPAASPGTSPSAMPAASPAAAPSTSPSASPGASRSASPGSKKREYGSQLALRDLSRPDAAERTFQDVLEYAFNKDAKTLVYAVSSRKEEENGVFVVSASSEAAAAALLRGKGKYNKLTWDRENLQLAFLSDRDDAASKQPKAKVYYWDMKAPAASALVSTSTPGFRPEFVVSERGALGFSRDGSRVFLSCAPPAPPEKPEPAATGDKVLADLWRWNDDYIQPMQKVQAARERNRAYTAVFHLANKKFAQLADKTMQSVVPSDDGRYAIGSVDKPYRSMVDFDGRYADYFILDTTTGARSQFMEKLRGGYGPGGMTWSPDGRRALFFRDRNWYAVNVPGGTTVNLTGQIAAKFFQEDDDHSEPAGPYGAAGWTKDGKTVLLYDRFDIWQVAAEGGSAVNLTNGLGRKQNTEFRVVRLQESEEDQKVRGIEREKPLLLRAENIETRETGFYRDRLDSAAPPEKLIMGPRNYRTVAKAKDADTIVVTASTFAEFPDLHVTDSSFRELRKVSDLNPQKAQIVWGSGELIRFRSADGVPLQAALYKPENFDPNRKYPMIVYIYEKLSQNLHAFVEPKPGTSINISYYVSNGYIVLTPDIVYTVGAPGQSALKCVLPAIQAVVDKGFVNEQAIGIQGHSWGGYQIAYMVTQTTRFRAAEAGAPVGNMISAYNGIRWGTGLPRQFQYEKTQSRIGGSLWQYPMRFVENSPVFMADRVQTPLLILHDDNDDAVPWYQGIELFMSLRRNGKEAYLFNYNGEMHGLRKRHNQKDYTVRMQQFFDHFLKGAPKPEWMEKGIPYIEREEEKEKFNAAADLR